MSPPAGLTQRLHHLADVVLREATHLAQTDLRLFGPGFALAEAASLQGNIDLAERVDAFVARFGRLQDTLGAVLLPRLLEALLEPTGSVLDNLNRAEKLGWVRSAEDWAALRLRRDRMVHGYVMSTSPTLRSWPRPDGHFKFLHLWPLKLPRAGRPNYGSTGALSAMREAASFRR